MSKTSFFKQSGTNNVGTSGNDATDPTEIADTASDSSFFKQNGVNSQVNSNLTQRATDAETAKTAAEAAQSAAEAAQTSAEASSLNASSASASASSSSLTAQTNAQTATTKASEASSSASAAAASEVNSASSETNSASSETNAASSEANALSSASSATTQAGIATSQAGIATTKAGEASTSATSAQTAQTASESARDLALSYRNTAETHKDASAVSSATATTQAGVSSAQATISTTKAGEASSSASSAASAQTAAEAARDSALTAFDNFDDRYLGSKTSDPTVDNDSNALVGGALYFDSTNGIVKVYTGSAWVAAYASTAGTLLVANNLGDVQSAATSRTNLGLSTVAATGAYSDLTGKPSLFDGAFSSLSGKPTTISGYGITDSFSGAYNDLTGKPTLFDGAFSSLSGKPTTIAGYGITDSLQLGTSATTALAGNTSIPSTLTDLGISDGSANQVLSTNGSGTFTFVNQSSGGGGATQDADGDTKIQVEEGTDDDTIRFDTAGSERAIIASGGGVGIATTDLGTETLTINKLSGNTYGSIQLRRSDTDDTNNGGIITFAQKDNANTSWVSLAGWDNGTDRTVYLGGGGWGKQEATKVQIYAGAYDSGSGGATARLTVDSSKVSINYSGANCLDFITSTTADNRGIAFDGRTALSADSTDGYLRLNDSSQFTNGVYTPANFRVDGAGIFLGQARSHNGWRNNNSVDTNITYGVSFSTSAPADGNGYNLLRESGSWTSPYPDIRMNAHTGFNMRANNNYDGVRIFRDYNDNNRIIQFNGSSNYIFKDVWMHTTTNGFYSSTNSMHLYPNNSTNYTSLAVTGSRGSYGGIVDNYSGVHFMHDSSGNGGNYRQSTGRWYFYHHVGNNCTGFSTSTTSSSYTIYVAGAIYATGNITAYSDARMKENIVTIDSALDKVCAMRGVYYNKIDDETKTRQVGVLAQEMLEPCPEAVTYAEDTDEYGVSYGNLVGVLIEAIKELRQEVAELKGN